MELKRIENLRLIIIALTSIIKDIKGRRKILGIILLNLNKVLRINFKELKLEAKDISEDERQELMKLIIEQGFELQIAEKVIAAFKEGKKIKDVIKELIKE
jgi:hypothetical protein